MENIFFAFILGLIIFRIYLNNKKSNQPKVAAQPKPEQPILDIFTQRTGDVVADYLSKYLKFKGYRYTVNENNRAFQMMFGNSEEDSVFIQIEIINDGKVLYFNTPLFLSVPDHQLQKITELVVRVNEILLIGNTQFSYEARQAYYEERVIIGHLELNPDLMDKYFDLLFYHSKSLKPLFHSVLEKNEEPIFAVMNLMAYMYDSSGE